MTELVLTQLTGIEYTPPDDYIAILDEAFRSDPPPHCNDWYGNVYRRLARDPEWFANSLVINADKEGYGSRQVWKFSQLVPRESTAELVRRHATDESKHSRMFVGVLENLFPSAVDESFRTELKALSPGFTLQHHPPTVPPEGTSYLTYENAVDQLIQIGYVEIRALVLQLLLRPVMAAYAPPELEAKMLRVSDVLISDELRHIRYAMQCTVEYMRDGHADWTREVMLARQSSLNLEFQEEFELEGISE